MAIAGLGQSMRHLRLVSQFQEGSPSDARAWPAAQAVRRRKKKTTGSDHDGADLPRSDLTTRTVDGPNQFWVADITYIYNRRPASSTWPPSSMPGRAGPLNGCAAGRCGVEGSHSSPPAAEAPGRQLLMF